MIFPFSFAIKRINNNRKWSCYKYVDGEVARVFLGAFSFWLFLLFRFVLKKYVWYKICSSDIALSNKKRLSWIRSRQHGLIVFDIFSITFASYVMWSLLELYLFACEWLQRIRRTERKEEGKKSKFCLRNDFAIFFSETEGVRVFVCGEEEEEVIEIYCFLLFIYYWNVSLSICHCIS